jgi:hypothetical protein
MDTSTASQQNTSGQATGDALEDDFGSDLEIDDDDVALTSADKKRKQRRLDKERKEKKRRAAVV